MATFGLIGYPLTHSFSKRHFTEKFENQKLNHTYINLEINPLKELNQTVFNNQLKGLNITIPHKENVVAFLSELSPEAKEIGAVNCIEIKRDQLIGHNTDHIGFSKSISPLLGPNHKNALILGTGGASKAIQYALKKLDIDFHMVSRKGNEELTYSDLKGRMNEFQVIINTTPLGTFPQTDSFPDIPFEELTKDHLCYDLVYNPTETEFLRKARSMGSMTKNGLEMLEIQAEESWRIWNS